MRNNLKCSCFLLRNLGLLFFFFQSLTITVLQQIGNHQYRVLLYTFIRKLSYIHRMFCNMPQIIFEYSLDCLRTFPGMFGDIARNVWGHSPECLGTYPGIFGNIPRDVWGHSAECMWTFSGIFEDIPWNIWGHFPSPKCLRTFLGMFEDIPQNVWRHSPEYNIPPVPRVPRIPFPVPVFLVLYIAFFYMTKSLDKNLNVLRTKRTFKKHFSSQIY